MMRTGLPSPAFSIYTIGPKWKVLIVLFPLLLSSRPAFAKEWRGITPLKSTRADVERILGKTDKFSRYQFEHERGSISYSTGPCEPPIYIPRPLNCECLVPKDTVLSIYVQIEDPLSFSKLNLDKRKFERYEFQRAPRSASYSNFEEGVVYTIDESEDDVTTIEYLPSAEDCQSTVKTLGKSLPSNSWRGLVPLRSTRADVERLLGTPKHVLGSINTYESETDKVNVTYSSGPCSRGEKWNVPADSILRFSVAPKATILVSHLRLDKNRYNRHQNVHPEHWVHYTSGDEGVMVNAELRDGCEEVMNIDFWPASKDKDLSCPEIKPKG